RCIPGPHASRTNVNISAGCWGRHGIPSVGEPRAKAKATAINLLIFLSLVTLRKRTQASGHWRSVHAAYGELIYPLISDPCILVQQQGLPNRCVNFQKRSGEVIGRRPMSSKQEFPSEPKASTGWQLFAQSHSEATIKDIHSIMGCNGTRIICIPPPYNF